MLTALVHANAMPAALAVTLSSLVPAVAEGLVSQAVVILPALDPAAERIADAMGATVIIAVSGHWQAAARTARGEWVLLLEAGETPGHGWISVIERHLLAQSSERARPALFPSARALPALRERFAVMFGSSVLRPGLVSPRKVACEGQSGGSPVWLPVKREMMAR